MCKSSNKPSVGLPISFFKFPWFIIFLLTPFISCVGESNPVSPANVAVVSPMPHMTKSRSVTESGVEGVRKPGDCHEHVAEDPLRGKLKHQT